MAQSLTDIKSDAITSVIANTISTINSTVSNVANNVTTLTSTVGNVAANVSNVQSTITTLVTPKISSITYPGDDTAALPAGGQTITLTGTGFNSGASVLINGTYASVVSVVSSTSITFTAPAMAAGTYILYVINTDGGTSISIPGISYSGTPIWSTSAGTLGTSYETSSISSTLIATGDAPITYSLFSGTLPPGSSLDSSSGLLSGTAQGVASSTTYNFTIRATDGQNQDTDRAFSITLNPDAVTWNSPADGTSTALFQNQVMSNVTLSATSAAGKSITYSANALPTGVTITGAVVNGTPTIVGTTNSLITATAATTNKTSTRNFTWVVSLANDIYFKNTTLLLNGETTVTPFISDASTNSFRLTINGDTKPVLFNPYRGDGYYSNYFDGTGDYLTAPNNVALQFGTGDFTVEAWVYITVSSGTQCVFDTRASDTSTTGVYFGTYLSNTLLIYTSGTVLTGGSIIPNTWTHIAVVRIGTTVTGYINGTSVASGTRSNNFTDTNAQIGASPLVSGSTINYFNGYISNLRVVKGTAVYTSAFTPNTTPLTAIANTSLLTCQSNRLIDNSTNAFTITKAGDVSVSPNIPFTQNSSYSTYGSTYFDGTGDTLYIPSPTTGFSFGTGEFTIEMWVYKTSAVNSVLLDARSSAAATPWVFVIDASNFPYFYDGTSYTSSVAVTLNSWNHVAAVRTSGVLKIFVNGVQGYSASYGTNLDRTAGLVIGDTVHAAGPLLGHISNLRIVKGTAVYTSAFTPPTAPLTAIANTQLLTCQYNGGANNSGIIDNSNFNNIITRNGNTSQGTFSPYSVTGWSNYFDGTGDNLLINYNSALHLSADFTIECWFYANAHGGMILNLAGGLNIAWASYELVTNGDGINFAASSANNGYDIGSESGATGRIGTIQLGTWNHLAVTRSGNIYRGFVNGVQGYTQTLALAPYNPNARGLAIGSNYATTWGSGTPSSVVNGYISNLRIVKDTALYTAAFTPSTTPLTAVANTQLLTCQSNRFIDNSPNSFALTRNGDVSVQAYSPFGSISEATPLSYSNFFDGSTSYLSIPNNAGFTLGTNNFCIEGWYYPISNTVYQALIAKRLNFNATGSFVVYSTQNSNVLKFYASSTGSSFNIIDGVTIGTTVNNTWNHFAVYRIGNIFYGALNGVVTNMGTSSSSFYVDSNPLYIGGEQNAGTPGNVINGYLTNIRIVNGSSVYTSNTFTPSTTPLTAIANTSLLTCQSTTIIDNSTNAFTITAVGNTVPRIFNPFGYTAQSATSYTPSLHGGSIYLDGTGDNLTTPNIASWQFGTGDFTVEFWVYAISSGTMVGLTSSGAGAGYWNAILSSGNVGWASGVVFRLTSGVSYFNGWMHVAYVRKSGTLNMYINGINQSSGADSTNYNATVGTLTIGSGDSYGTMTGYISDLRITKGTALYTSNFVPPTQTIGNYSTSYPSQLLLNMNNAGIIDQHGTNVLETVGNAQLSTAVKKYGNASMYFDGTGDYLKIPNSQNFNFGSGNFTVEGWVYCINTSSRQDIFTTPSNASGFNGLSFAIYNGNFELTMSWTGGWDILFATAGSVSANTWYHFAVVRNGGTVTVYINGTSTYSNSGLSTSSLVFGTDPATISYGRVNQSDARYLYGYIDDLRITKGVARYTTTFTPPTTALITK